MPASPARGTAPASIARVGRAGHSPVQQRRPARASATVTSSSTTVTLPDSTRLEVLSALPAGGAPPSPRPPLLFVHGSAHAAWCWAEHWLPHFAARGWAAHAVSLRGRGGSGPPPAGARAGGTLATHAADLQAVIEAGYGGARGGGGAPPTPPVLIGHSFGGLIAQRAAADPAFPRLAGLALAASVPPSGNGPMVKRIAKARGLWSSAVLTADFIFKTYRADPAAARRLFFSDAMPGAEVERLMRRLAAQDGATPVVDVRALGRELPVPPPCRPVPAFVLGGGADAIVDEAGLAEAAAAVGAAAPPTVVPGLAHDVMLDVGWEAAADALAGWLEAL